MAEDKSREDRVAEDRGREDRVTEDKSREDRVAEDRGREDRVTENRSREDRVTDSGNWTRWGGTGAGRAVRVRSDRTVAIGQDGTGQGQIGQYETEQWQ